jgi:hypothetical protein
MLPPANEERSDLPLAPAAAASAVCERDQNRPLGPRNSDEEQRIGLGSLIG